MANAKIVVKVTPKKTRGGTIIAKQVAKIEKTDSPKGKPFFQTRAKIDVHLAGKNGRRRR